ncbi:phage recombination protein Bet [Gluconacetobacter azotocaptans]|uniref:phage recombination protein Bet n=1 Tax=Gluconacetobacter azotocaptans TaxID=142834 RepID=UPI00195ECD66|nr:phage recombination protein Bet [Gluconacetobacter azotocaptans]MBM9401597.1 phage recombination protein Bet [Gluconacetobacter azotocaptans]
MNAVAKTSQQMAAVTKAELLNVLKSSLYPGASDASVQLVMGYCRAAGLDVMKKPVHIVPIWSKAAGGMVDTIMPGIALYRTEASRTGDYVGKTEPEFGPDMTRTLGGVSVTFPSWCKMTVHRMVHGDARSYTAKEFWLENYATAKRDTDAPNAMWKKRPYGQLAKCAEAQALRMAFPEQTGGTNTNDEMEGKTFDGPVIDVTPDRTPTPRVTHERRPVDYVALFDARLVQCTDMACVDRQWKVWASTVEKAQQAGRPIDPEIVDKIQGMIGERMADMQERENQRAAEMAEVDADEVPA